MNPNRVFKEDHSAELACCSVDYRWDGAGHRWDIGERNHEEAVLERSQRMTANTAFHGIMGTSTGPHPHLAPQATMPPGRVPDMGIVYFGYANKRLPGPASLPDANSGTNISEGGYQPVTSLEPNRQTAADGGPQGSINPMVTQSPPQPYQCPSSSAPNASGDLQLHASHSVAQPRCWQPTRRLRFLKTCQCFT